MNIRKTVAACALAALAAACSISGARNGDRAYNIAQMEQMSAIYFKEFSDNHNITTSAVKELRRSQCVMRALTRAVSGAFAGMRTEWAVEITRDCSMNATVLAHGHLLLSNCVVGKLNNQDQEAYIIAHALAHTLLEHDNERLSQFIGDKARDKSFNFKGWLRGEGGYDIFTRIAGLPDREGKVIPYTSEHEKAADLMAIQTMAVAGFNPSGALIVWQNMQRDPELNAAAYVAAHPHTPEYLNNISTLVQDAMPVYREARTNYGRVPLCQ